MPEPVDVLNAHTVLPSWTMNSTCLALSTSTTVPGAVVWPWAFSVANVMANAVLLSTLPEALSPLYFWKAITAWVVAKPYWPSGPLFQKPRSSNRCWTSLVAAPLLLPTAGISCAAQPTASTLDGNAGAGGSTTPAGRAAAAGAAATGAAVSGGAVSVGAGAAVVVGGSVGGAAAAPPATAAMPIGAANNRQAKRAVLVRLLIVSRDLPS